MFPQDKPENSLLMRPLLTVEEELDVIWDVIADRVTQRSITSLTPYPTDVDDPLLDEALLPQPGDPLLVMVKVRVSFHCLIDFLTEAR